MNNKDLEHIASVAHEANRAFCKTLGDTNHRSWEEATEWQRQASLDMVKNIIENPDITAEQTHEQWMKFKLDTGWSYGITKDENKKLHPSLVPYAELPRDEKLKDHLFRSVVIALLQE